MKHFIFHPVVYEVSSYFTASPTIFLFSFLIFSYLFFSFLFLFFSFLFFSFLPSFHPSFLPSFLPSSFILSFLFLSFPSCFLALFNFFHYVCRDVKWNLIVVLLCTFLMTNDAEHLFMCLPIFLHLL